jgi:phosphate starvation-inducible PhoH-like protein
MKQTMISNKTSSKTMNKTSNKSKFIPRNTNQVKYTEFLNDKTRDIVIASGPAGSAKTYIGTLVGVEHLLDKKVDRIVITRPAITVDDENHGFLPGTLNNKMKPWMMPIYDVLQLYFNMTQIEKMMADNLIEVSPLAYMRGRTFDNAYILLDEAQNCTTNQMLMALTRIGQNSKLVITGDPMQHDRNAIGQTVNGLSDLIEKIERSQDDRIVHVGFDHTDVERHPVIPHVLAMYQ